MRFAAAILIALLSVGMADAAGRVVSLDQCSDQYVLALADRSDIAALSPRAGAADAWLRDRARGLPMVRPSLEAVLGRRPTIVVRQWGGGPRLDAALSRSGVRTVKIADVRDFDGVRRELRKVARALGHPERGEALIFRMDGQLARARNAWRGQGALYLTDGAFTAGPGTLIDALLRAVGLTNLSRKTGFAPAPLERVMLAPPAVVVFGRFSSAGDGRWAPVRGPLLASALRRSRRVELPGALLACPAWFVGDAAERLAEAAPR